jgi:ribosome-binding factor A
MIERPDERPKTHHAKRIAEAIAHAAADFIRDEAGTNSLITVTRAHTTKDRVTVFVSVLPEEQTKNALTFLARKRQDFSNYLKSHARLGPLPRVEFLPESGEFDTLAAADTGALGHE